MPFEDALQAIERQVVDILANDQVRQQPGAGRTLAQGRLRLLPSDNLRLALLAAARADILMLDVVADEGGGRPIVELRRGLGADLLTQLATVGTEQLRLGQAVMHRIVRQVLGRPLAAMAFAFAGRRARRVALGGAVFHRWGALRRVVWI